LKLQLSVASTHRKKNNRVEELEETVKKLKKQVLRLETNGSVSTRQLKQSVSAKDTMTNMSRELIKRDRDRWQHRR
jgi:DNA-directed RNA polymerase alpha subunit